MGNAAPDEWEFLTFDLEVDCKNAVLTERSRRRHRSAREETTHA